MNKYDSIIETVHKLFVHTDYQRWQQLQDEVFTEKVHLDMRSAGGTAEDTTAKAICAAWEEGFRDLDAVHHLAGNHLVTLLNDGEAEVFCYANATHYKESATRGKVREFVGGYELHLVLTPGGWRIDRFVYHLKYVNGNVGLE